MNLPHTSLLQQLLRRGRGLVASRRAVDMSDDTLVASQYLAKVRHDRPRNERAKVVADLGRSAPMMNWTPPVARSGR